MMNINPKELQKFHDLWAPMIAALPAVINAAESAAEIENHLAIKRAEFADIDAKCAKREADAEASVKSAQERTTQAKANHALELAALDAEAKEAKAAVRKAKSDAAAKVAEHQSTVAEAHQQLVKARADNVVVMQELQAAHDARKAELETEVAALEAKRDEVKSVIESLRKQLLG